MATQIRPATSRDLIREAVREQSGYSRPLSYWRDWLERLLTSGNDDRGDRKEIEAALLLMLMRELKRVARHHKGLPAHAVERLKPMLKQRTLARVQVASDLLRLRRKEALSNTLARFAGWQSSIGPGEPQVKSRELVTRINKPLAQIEREKRRIMQDQARKEAASIHETIARESGALALIWHSNWRVPGYHYRPDHKERDELVWVLPGNWASKQGLISPRAPSYDDITHVGQEPNCKCYAQFLYTLEDLPADMLTSRGKMALNGLRRAA